jgi:heme exporter protein CcmD
MDVFAMGEYGPFVWWSYLLTLVVVILSALQTKRRHRQITSGIIQRLKAQEGDE